jgi:two-component system, cell cycle response regulator
MSEESVILIVDDEPKNRQLLEAILEPEGYRLVFAENGEEALRQTIENRPDLVLLDVMMPDITGFEVCELIRQDPDLAEIPVIMITALVDKESRLKGIDVGADDFLSKPVDALELKARVKTVTRLNRYRSIVSEREKFERIADFASDGFLLLNRSNEIHYANARARSLLSLGESCQGQDFYAATDANFKREPLAGWDEWVNADAVDTNALRYLVRPESPKGSAVWLQVELFHLPQTGRGEWLVRLANVTGLLAQKRDFWNFHKILSHKLRTPLNGLISSLDMITDPAHQLSTECQSLASNAKQSAHRLNDQIKDILLFIQAPKLSQIGTGTKVEEIAAKARQAASAFSVGSVKLDVELDDVMVGRAVALGGNALDLVLSEVIENAQKFHPKMTPQITIHVGALGDDRAAITISDDGATLAADTLANATRPYYQGESKFTGEIAGMGLGLAMLNSIIWESGGSLQLANRESGPGVQVTIALPLIR